MINWNQEGFKVGHCHQSPLNMNYSMLALSNNTGTRHILSRMRTRFNKIYKQKVFVHHYTKYMDVKHFDEALNNCTEVISTYEDMEIQHVEKSDTNALPSVTQDYQQYRFKPII